MQIVLPKKGLLNVSFLPQPVYFCVSRICQKKPYEYISMKYDELVFDGGKKQMGDFNRRIIDY